MQHKHLPLTLVLVGLVVGVFLALGSMALPPEAVEAQYPPPDRPTVIPPTGVPPTTVPPTVVPSTTVPPAPRPSRGGSSGGDEVDLAIEQSASSTALVQGDLVTLVLTTRHIAGSAPADDVLIFVELPVFFSVYSARTSWGTFEIEGEQIAVRIPALYPGDEVTTTVVGVVEEPPLYNQMQIIASVATSTKERSTTNNLAPVFMTFAR